MTDVPSQDQPRAHYDGGRGDIVALVPNRLAIVEHPSAVMQVLDDLLLRHVADLASEWQSISQNAPIWESAAALRGVHRGRMQEVAGLMAAIGEQVALARAALIECELWNLQRSSSNQPGDEMCHRSFAELLTYYCLGAGHGLVNLTGRLLALDRQLHGALIDQFGSVFPPHSTDPRDWLACNVATVRSIRRVTKQSMVEAHREVEQAATDLVAAPAWSDLLLRRGTDFHRRRPQSDGVVGVPLTPLWEHTTHGAWTIAGELPASRDGSNLARTTTATARDSLDAVTRAMVRLRGAQSELVRTACGGGPENIC